MNTTNTNILSCKPTKKVTYYILKKTITSTKKNNLFYATNFGDIVHPRSAFDLRGATLFFYDVKHLIYTAFVSFIFIMGLILTVILIMIVYIMGLYIHMCMQMM